MSDRYKTQLTELPGMKGVKVIVVEPQLIKENSQYNQHGK